MKRAFGGFLAMGAALLSLGSCGNGGGATVFQGTCLEPLYACFRTNGAGTCSYDNRIHVAKLSFANGAYVNSGSSGADPNRCFGPDGPLCMTVTTINDTTKNVAGKIIDGGTINVSVVDDGSGKLQINCPDGTSQTIDKPTPNPSFEDLRRCVLTN